MTPRSYRRLAAAVLTGIALTTGLAACGDDSESSDLTAACMAQADTIAGFAAIFTTLPEPPDSGPPPPEYTSQVQSRYDANVATPLAALVANAPDEIKDEVEEIATKSRQFRDEGDPAVLDDADFSRLTDSVDAYMQENCAGTKVKVEAKNYSYQDLPTTLPLATVRFEFENETDEAHEMVLLTRKPGVTETFDEILALPGDQIESKIDFIDATSTDPGQTGYLVTTFRAPGDFIVVCSFGKGTTDDDEPKEAEPHFTLGMKQEIKVA